jgi:hypothetical protein
MTVVFSIATPSAISSTRNDYVLEVLDDDRVLLMALNDGLGGCYCVCK